MHHQLLQSDHLWFYFINPFTGSQHLPHAFPEATLERPAGKEGEERMILFEYEPLESGISWEKKIPTWNSKSCLRDFCEVAPDTLIMAGTVPIILQGGTEKH